MNAAYQLEGYGIRLLTNTRMKFKIERAGQQYLYNAIIHLSLG